MTVPDPTRWRQLSPLLDELLCWCDLERLRTNRDIVGLAAEFLRLFDDQHRKPGAIVATIFQAPQPFDEDGSRLLFSDVSNYAAHG